MSAFWRDRPTLVTGASGFLGGWVTARLVGAGAAVVCLVRDWVPQSELVQSGILARVKVVRGDVRDQALLEGALGENEVQTVFHLAAQTVVPVANRNPISTLETNAAGTWRLLEACRRSPTVRAIVLASSDKAYGASDVLPYREETPLRGRHPYDVSKACADLVAQAYAATYRLPVAITRCGNLYGGGDLNWNRLVPGTIRAVFQGQRPIVRSDGHAVRDFMYVEDAADAYLRLAERLDGNGTMPGRAFNFSPESPRRVVDVVRLVLQSMDSGLEPDVRGEASHEIQEQYLSATRAHEEIGWRAAFTIEEGLRRTIAWYRAFLGGTP